MNNIFLNTITSKDERNKQIYEFEKDKGFSNIIFTKENLKKDTLRYNNLSYNMLVLDIGGGIHYILMKKLIY